MSCEQLCTETFQCSEATAAAAERSPPAPARSVEEMGWVFFHSVSQGPELLFASVWFPVARVAGCWTGHLV